MIFISQFSISDFPRSFEFASKHSYGRSFPLVDSRHFTYFIRKANCCLPKVQAEVHTQQQSILRADFKWQSDVIVSLNTLKITGPYLNQWSGVLA